MHPVQIVVLVVLVAGTIIYTWHRIRREIRSEREFFRALVEQLSTVLLPKGLHLTRSADFSKSVRGTVATFEGPVFSLELFWDYMDRQVILLQRETERPRSERQTIASPWVSRYFNPGVFAEASAVILAAAARSGQGTMM